MKIDDQTLENIIKIDDKELQLNVLKQIFNTDQVKNSTILKYKDEINNLNRAGVTSDLIAQILKSKYHVNHSVNEIDDIINTINENKPVTQKMQELTKDVIAQIQTEPVNTTQKPRRISYDVRVEPNGKRIDWSKSQRNEIVKLFKSGMNETDISELFKVKPKSIVGVLHRMGISVVIRRKVKDTIIKPDGPSLKPDAHKFHKKVYAKLGDERFNTPEHIALIRVAHEKNLPKNHTNQCPACNPNSKLTWVEYRNQMRKQNLESIGFVQAKSAVDNTIDELAKKGLIKSAEEARRALNDKLPLCTCNHPSSSHNPDTKACLRMIGNNITCSCFNYVPNVKQK